MCGAYAVLALGNHVPRLLPSLKAIDRLGAHASPAPWVEDADPWLEGVAPPGGSVSPGAGLGPATPPPTPEPQPDPLIIPLDTKTYTINGQAYTLRPGIYNILFLGIDTADTRSVTQNGYQSDMMVLMVVDTLQNQISCVNIPRDTWAQIPLLDRRGNLRGRKMGKINSAYSQGGGRLRYSYRNATSAVETLFCRVPVHAYVGIDMDSVAPLVDAVGGVPLELEITNPIHGWIDGQTQTLAGREALAYVRQRKGNGLGGSDIGRVERQMNFIRAYMAAAQQVGFAKMATDVLPSVNRYVDTNLSVSDMVWLARRFQELDTTGVSMRMLEGRYSHENWVPDKAALLDLVVELYFDKTQPSFAGY